MPDLYLLIKVLIIGNASNSFCIQLIILEFLLILKDSR